MLLQMFFDIHSSKQIFFCRSMEKVKFLNDQVSHQGNRVNVSQHICENGINMEMFVKKGRRVESTSVISVTTQELHKRQLLKNKTRDLTRTGGIKLLNPALKVTTTIPIHNKPNLC
jgi:hypothetical protein